MSFLQVVANDPTQPVRVVAQIDKARTLASGEKELLPNGKQDVVIGDFFAAATEPELALMAALIVAIKSRAGV